MDPITALLFAMTMGNIDAPYYYGVQQAQFYGQPQYAQQYAPPPPPCCPHYYEPRYPEYTQQWQTVRRTVRTTMSRTVTEVQIPVQQQQYNTGMPLHSVY